jgi:hypothetical protein
MLAHRSIRLREVKLICLYEVGRGQPALGVRVQKVFWRAVCVLGIVCRDACELGERGAVVGRHIG